MMEESGIENTPPASPTPPPPATACSPLMTTGKSCEPMMGQDTCSDGVETLFNTSPGDGFSGMLTFDKVGGLIPSPCTVPLVCDGSSSW